jgi:hypothetical protein
MRPKLNRQLSEEKFLQHYWLKSELTLFCRELGLAVQGSKQQLTERIADRLAGRPQKTPKSSLSRTVARGFVLTNRSALSSSKV